MKKNSFYTLFIFILIIFFGIISLGQNPNKTVAVIGAMDEEINEIKNNLKNSKTIKKNDFTITTGILGNHSIVISKSGVGKVAAASTTQFIIDNYKPTYIINTGIAGSLSNALKARDLIIAEKMFQHDFDVTAFGHPKGYIDNGIEPDKPTAFYSDKTLIKIFQQETALHKDMKIKLSTIATGDIFVNQEAKKNEIKEGFQAEAVDMESAAIAQTAQRNNIPLIVIRTISDSENDSTVEYEQNKESSAQKSASLVISILNKKS